MLRGSMNRQRPRVLRLLLSTLALLAIMPHHVSASPVVLAGFPALRQQHHLTCESSAASMATRATVTESQLMAAMPRDPDPNLGFRGNPDGWQGTSLIDYGVYGAPLQNALRQFGYHSELKVPATDGDIRNWISRGWPVVAWVTYRLQKARPRLAEAHGMQFVLVPHEHAIMVFGYDRSTVIANDPWDQKQVRYYWDDFNRSWGYFGNMALAVDPCPQASPVTGLQTSDVSSNGITWVWRPAPRAAQYAITVIRHGQRDRVIYSGSQRDVRYTQVSPKPGFGYEIQVRSLSACGEQTGVRRLTVQVVGQLPTPTAVPTEVASPAPTPTLTTTPTASATVVAEHH